jgi:hypothetical protein
MCWYAVGMRPVVDLDEELNEIAGHLNAQHARLAGVARELLDDPAKWASEGIFTIERYLCWKTGISRGHAQQIADIARRGDELPEFLEAFERGELSLDQATVVARRAPGWADAEVTALAKLLTVDQLRRSVGRYPFPLVPDSMLPGATEPGSPADGGDDGAADGLIGPPVPADHQVPEPGHRFGHGGGCCGGEADPVDRMSFGFDDAGRFHLHLDTDQATGMIVDRALEEARDALFQGGHTDVNWIDAIREMANRSLDAVASPSRRNRWRINMNLSTTGRATDGAGFSLPDAIRHHLTCDGYITPVFLDNGVPVSVGRSQHIVPDRTRRVVEHRDGGCAVPGCNARHFLEVHHIIHWEHHGVTETWNLICLCPHHHRLHHQGKLGISGNADVAGGVHFTDAAGKPLTPSGARPTPPGAPPTPPPSRYDHPHGERLDYSLVHFNPPAAYRQMIAQQTRATRPDRAA